MKKIYIAGDHAGYELKKALMESDLFANAIIEDLGPFSEESVDYPDFATPLATAVAEDAEAKGILICGSGNGVCMTANKNAKVRAGLAWTPEIAELTRLHNDANVVCIPARFIDQNTAFEIVKTFINTEFEGGRHQRRVDKIAL